MADFAFVGGFSHSQSWCRGLGQLSMGSGLPSAWAMFWSLNSSFYLRLY